ncbi:MAG TPA: porin [Vicinamibacterales bacterium]|nr:porin [Vicinamibacterales bacterium]
MQKKLLSLAVAGALAAPAAALAQVEVYGTIHMSFNFEKYGEGTGGVPSVDKTDVASHASNIGVRARENLGGGLSAWAQVETNASMERSNNVAHTSNFASRNSAVGLQGNWGNLFVGQWTTPWADLDALWGIGTVATYGPITSIIGRRETTGSAPNPNCANTGAGVGGVTSCDSVEGGGGVGHPFWRRISNSVHYQSPVFGGAQIKVAYQTNQDKASTGVTANPQMWSASVTWAGMGGRLRVGAAYDQHEEFTSAGNDDTGWRVTGGWNFGFADIGLAYEQMTYKTAAGDCDAEQIGIGIAIPIGQGAIRGSYSQAEDIDGPFTGAPTFTTGSCGAVGTGDNGAKQYNIGYDYRFSKRTTVGVGYAKIENDPFAVFTWSGLSSSNGGLSINPPAGSDVEIFFVSMIHRF